MHKIHEVLRLRHDAGLSYAQIARACGLSKGVVSKYLNLAKAQAIGWPLPAGLDEDALVRQLFPERVAADRFVAPDYPQLHQELKRKGVTLQLLWTEYTATHGHQAYRYREVLRTLPAMVPAAEAQHAAASCGRREAVHRLLRADRAGDRSHER